MTFFLKKCVLLALSVTCISASTVAVASDKSEPIQKEIRQLSYSAFVQDSVFTQMGDGFNQSCHICSGTNCYYNCPPEPPPPPPPPVPPPSLPTVEEYQICRLSALIYAPCSCTVDTVFSNDWCRRKSCFLSVTAMVNNAGELIPNASRNHDGCAELHRRTGMGFY